MIVEVLSEHRNLAMIDVLGVRRKVDLGLLQDDPPVKGDWVLIHVGFAMSKISEADAKDQLRMLTSLGEEDAAIEEVRGYGLGGAEEPEGRAGPPNLSIERGAPGD
jgi:hydrogenase expression/formation protein HypC